MLHNLTDGLSEHLYITSPMYMDQRVAYTQLIIKGFVLKNYREVMVGFRQSAKELAGDEWNLGKLAGLCADYFWT